MDKDGNNYTSPFGPGTNQETKLEEKINGSQDNQTNQGANTSPNTNTTGNSLPNTTNMNQNTNQGQSYNQGQNPNIKMSKRDFYRNFVPKKLNQNILAGAVCSYIVAGITAFVWIFVMIQGYSYLYLMYRYVIFDACLALGLGLAWHLRKSRAIAVIMTVYFIASKLVQVAQGAASVTTLCLGGAITAIFVVATIATFKAYTLWDQYQKTGTIE